MTVRIHPAEKPKEYTELLLALLAQAGIPALTDALLAEEGGAPAKARPA